MKAWGFFSLLLGLASIAVSVFAKVETWSNFKSLATAVKSGETNLLEMRLVADYADTLSKLHYVAWATGGLALIIGVVVMAKRRGTNLVPALGAWASHAAASVW